MKTSKAGLDLVKKWEGCKLTAYKCPANVWTIGYGHTSAAGEPKVVQGMKISADEAERILAQDLVKYEQAVERAITRPMTQPQFDAMTSLCFNIGQGAFAGSSVARRFNEGNISGAADAFLMWNKAGGRVLTGLENRRKDERAHFLKSAPVTAPQPKPVEPVAPSPAPVPPPKPETPAAPLPDTGQGTTAIIIGAIGAIAAAIAAYLFGG